MIEDVDEAVAKALHGVQKYLSGEEDIDAFVEQSLITLGGMVKITGMALKLDISPATKMLMGMNLNAYRRLIDEIAAEVLKGD